ncbi:phosphoglucosamine mutase [Candidatus Woesearchaeota archaeon]|nr:phosphoglucosamine mutase [Candidatus Woesearchaeota archaeon]
MMKLFGTDGIRGKANQHPMTPDLMIKLGKAIAKHFSNKGKKTRILIGKDTRLSGYMIEYALVSGMCSMGADVLLVGPMPTPAIAHLTKSFAADAGIVISASHNPADDNGVKIFGKDGFKLPDNEEKKIEMMIEKDVTDESVVGDRIGKASRIDDAQGRYIEFAKASIKNNSLDGIKIILDCANGAAYKVAPLILSELGAEVIPMGNKPDGLNINQKVGAMHPEVIQKKVVEEKADIGLALDGDGDRIIMSDEKGNTVDGDKIMAIIADYWQRQGKMKWALVATQYSNMGLDIAMKKIGVDVIRTNCGDRYVVEEMRRGKHRIGGEQSGHIILLDHATTGDGIIASLYILDIMKRTGKRLSELASVMRHLPQVIVNVKVKERKPIERLDANKEAKKAQESLGGTGRVFLRYSGTENKLRVMVEAEDPSEVKRISDSIAKKVKEEIGE